MSTPPSILESSSTAQSPVPPPKDVPWWGAIILAILVAVVSVVGTIYATKSPASTLPGAPPGFGELFTSIITFLPHVLILFGILADIFTLQGAYSIPSLVGLCSIPLNKLLGIFWSGVAMVLADAYNLVMTGAHLPAASPIAVAAAVTPGCEIPGFEFLRSDYAPQGLVVTASVFWYYLLDLMINRNPIDSSITWVAFLLFFGAQAYQMKACSNLVDSFFVKLSIAFVEGFIIGGTGYGIVQATIPSRLPSAVLPIGPNLSSLTKNADGTYRDAAGATYVVGPDGRPLSAAFLAAAAKATP